MANRAIAMVSALVEQVLALMGNATPASPVSSSTAASEPGIIRGACVLATPPALVPPLPPLDVDVEAWHK